MNKRKITLPGSNKGKPYVGKDNYIVLVQILLVFGLGGDRLIHSNKYVKKSKVRKVEGGSDVHSIISKHNWKL